jgi:UDP-N-acetylmuramoylalanine--D-glutamate ligase
MQDLLGKKIVVLGAGVSGCAAARLAHSLNASSVALLDSAPAEKFTELSAQLASDGITLICGDAAQNYDGACDIAVISPGVPNDCAMATRIRAKAAVFKGELEFAFRYCPWPVYAVTGTNGKTTTVELFTACLKAVGKKVMAGGNIGTPLSQIALEKPELDCLVAEVSSFQLENATDFHPTAAILLNVTPDHLNRHGTIEAYRGLKTSLLEHIAYCGHAVCNAQLDSAVNYPQGVSRARIWNQGEYNASAKLDGVRDYAINAQGIIEINDDGSESLLVKRSSLQLRGNHNLQNVASVIAAMSALGYNLADYRMALENFHSGAHRIQTVVNAGGVKYIDDSKATDVDALIQALRTIGPSAGKNIILIAGGLDKGCALSEAKSELRMYVKSIYLIGQCRERLAQQWKEIVDCTLCESIEAAVEQAAKQAVAGDIVLLSPACASMDQFKDYAERGERFRLAAEHVTAEEK